MNNHQISYGEAIREGFEYLLTTYPECFVIGQGLWSPWYVGNSMTDLDKKFGKERIIDTPVSESACTGAAVGASLAGFTLYIFSIYSAIYGIILFDEALMNFHYIGAAFVFLGVYLARKVKSK